VIMGKNYSKLFAAALCMFGATVTDAQDIHFSQFYENAILRNPGLTGIFSGDYKGGVNYRSQWGQISVPFTTVLASAEMRKQLNEETGDCVSFGLTATYDQAGSIDFNSLQVYPAIAYNKALEDAHGSFLTLGFAAGYIQRTTNPSKMTFSSQYVNGEWSGSNGSGETINFNQVNHFDMGAGLSFNSSMGRSNNVNYYIGVSAFHVLRPRNAFSNTDYFTRLNMKWQGNLGIKAQLSNQFGLLIHGNYSIQSPYEEIIAGALLSYSASDQNARPFTFYLGSFYRVKDAIIPTLKLDYKTYSVTVSYDMNNSNLKTASNGMGGFEISLYARGFFKRESIVDMIKCPRFEVLTGVGQ
jgi:type IX secretion system PorP/SprF family membrane protein